MAVQHDATSESHTGAIGSISQASFAWSHIGAASGVDSVLVFIIGLVTGNNDTISVDYGGKALSQVTPNGFAQDTAGEPMSCVAYFYGGTDIPQGTQTITVTRANNTNELWACAATQLCTVAGKIGIVTGAVVRQGDLTQIQLAIDDGSPGTNSVRYAGTGSGLAAFPPAGAASTNLHNFDTGNQTASVVRETTAGQGSRAIGFNSATVEDMAGVFLAVKEGDPAAGTNHEVFPSDSVTMSDSLKFERAISIVESAIALADALAFQRDIHLADSVTMSDDVTTETGKEALIDDTVGLSDSVSFERDIHIDDAAGLSDNTTAELGKEIAVDDTVTLSDDTIEETGKEALIDDTVAISDSFSFAIEMVIAESVSIIDQLATEHNIELTVADVLALADFVVTELNPEAGEAAAQIRKWFLNRYGFY